MENKLISGENEVEELSDKIRGSYWSKYCDGRPFIEENWIMKKMSSGDFILSKKSIKSKNKLFSSNKNPHPKFSKFLIIYFFQ